MEVLRHYNLLEKTHWDKTHDRKKSMATWHGLHHIKFFRRFEEFHDLEPRQSRELISSLS